GIGPFRAVQLDGLFSVVDCDGAIAEAVEKHPQKFADGLIVVDDHDLRFMAHLFLTDSTTKQSQCREPEELFWGCELGSAPARACPFAHEGKGVRKKRRGTF